MTGAVPDLLAVRGLLAERPGAVLLNGVTFAIRPGETMALVGESGCGKSLSALAVLGLLPEGIFRTAGEILFEGQDMAHMSPRQVRMIRGKDIGFVMQDPMASLDPVLPIGTQLAEAIKTHLTMPSRRIKQRVLELLDLAGVPEPGRRSGQFPHQLSGGLRQRVTIAMAIACSPKLLIADEPTTALELTTQIQVLDLLDHLRRELSMALLLITHDLSIVARRADRVSVMYAGRVLESAAVDDFFAHPRHPYSKGLLGASLGADTQLHYSAGRLPEIPGSVASALMTSSGCPFAPRCGFATALCQGPLPKPPAAAGLDHYSACLRPNPEENA